MKRIYRENLLQGILDNSLDAFIITDHNQVVQEWNESAERMFGWTEAEAVGKKINELIVPEMYKRFHDKSHTAPAESYKDKEAHPILNRRLDLPAVHKNGSTIFIELTVTPIDVDGQLFFAATVRDLTERKKDHAELSRRANLINLSRDAIYVMNSDQKLTLWSRGAKELYGYTEEEALGKASFELLKSEFKATTGLDFFEIVQVLVRKHFWEGEIVQVTKSGERLHILSRCSLDVEKKEVLVTNTDITALKKNQMQAEFLATHDALTGLPNRRLLDDRLEHAMTQCARSNGKFAVMLMDLDRFKVINDSMGHDKGDILLKEVAHRLTKIVRAEDTVARLGGDEFVVLIENITDSTVVGEIAEKLVAEIAKPIRVGDRDLVVDVSIGIAIYPSDGSTVPLMMSNADMAMYRAKGNDDGTFVFYSSEMNEVVQRRLNYEHELRRALENNEFVLYYQPKVCAVDGRATEKQTIGVEALIRWNHPTKGLIMPGEFISVAEEIGMIPKLGEWVLREACRQNKCWQDSGLPPVCMSVNLSLHQLNTDIVRTLERVLSDTGLNPGFLDLEITESAAMKNVEQTILTLERIRALGIRLSMDDFGTGYSSMSYLMKMPIDCLKIDQSFIRGIGNGPQSQQSIAIVNSIIVLAKSMGLKTVAEGVTTCEQVAVLDTFLCDELQGYLFSTPICSEFMEQVILMKHWDSPYDKLSQVKTA